MHRKPSSSEEYEINIVSGGYVSCVCGASFTRVGTRCPRCSAPIDVAAVRITHSNRHGRSARAVALVRRCLTRVHLRRARA